MTLYDVSPMLVFLSEYKKISMQSGRDAKNPKPWDFVMR